MRGQDIYPSGVREAEQVIREYQGISGEGVTIPTGLFYFGCGLLGGIILGPALMATTKGGSDYLARMARTKLGG